MNEYWTRRNEKELKEGKTCSRCHILKPKEVVKRINKQWVCKPCLKESKVNHREHLKRDILGIRTKSDQIKEWAEKRKEKEGTLVINCSRPRSLSFFLSQTEKQVLFKKYVKMGLSYDEADQRLKADVNFLRDLVLKLRQQNKSESDINTKFKEEFAKLLMNSMVSK